MATTALSRGIISTLTSAESYNEPVVMQVKTIQPKDETKYKGVLTDGTNDIQAVFASQICPLAAEGKLTANSIVKVTGYTMNTIPGVGMVMMVSELEILAPQEDAVMTDVSNMKVGTPVPSKTPLNKIKSEHHAFSPVLTPTMVKTEPSSQQSAGPTPPSAASLSVSKRSSGFSAIAALHPYESDWKIKVKLVRKAPLRSVKLKGQDTSILVLELLDNQGTQIQATAWRSTLAEHLSATLQEGKVYVFERFQVKPANKQYSTVRNDYEIVFTDKTDVSEAQDQDAAEAMTAAVEHVPIEQLPRYVTRKMPADVIGVVVSMGSAGTVKRKSDNSELARRDITLADKSGKTVVLTVWGDNVSKMCELEGCEGKAVLQATACRVTDYNGCSLSTLSRSTLSINPRQVPQTQELLSWWGREGCSMTLQPVGGEAAAAKTSGAAVAKNTLHTVKEVVGQTVPEPDAKPTYHNLLATVVYINPEQPMYYLANPETGRKVVEQGGRYFSEGDGKYCDAASHRYVMSCKVLDATGDVYVSLFNEQAEQVMGCTADDMAALKASSEQAFTSRCKAAQWSNWSISVSTKSREYQGERKLRHTVVSVKPVNFVQDGFKLLNLIERY